MDFFISIISIGNADTNGTNGNASVGAVDEDGNELAGKPNVPSSAEEGWMRDEKRNCEATTIRADGVVLVYFHKIS